MEKVNFIVDPDNVKSSLAIIVKAISGNTEAIEVLAKANKRLALGIFCLSVAGFFTARELQRHVKRMNEMQKQIDVLKLQTKETPASE